jgi:hypothetical protein
VSGTHSLQRMRKLSLSLLVALVVLPTAAFAARKTTGDGVFELRAANGIFVLNGRGVLWGQMDKGFIKVTEVSPANGQQEAFVSGAEHSLRAPEDPNVTTYWGTNLHFRATGGKYRIRFRGTGVDLSTIGVGTADITGNPDLLDQGHYALDGGKWVAVPLGEKLVPFGTQPPVGPSTGP